MQLFALFNWQACAIHHIGVANMSWALVWVELLSMSQIPIYDYGTHNSKQWIVNTVQVSENIFWTQIQSSVHIWTLYWRRLLIEAIQVHLRLYNWNDWMHRNWKYFQSKLWFFLMWIGGPLILDYDDGLIGVTSCSTNFAEIQIFTNVPFYYGWIEEVTGLEMPKCNKS